MLKNKYYVISRNFMGMLDLDVFAFTSKNMDTAWEVCEYEIANNNSQEWLFDLNEELIGTFETILADMKKQLKAKLEYADGQENKELME